MARIADRPQTTGRRSPIALIALAVIALAVLVLLGRFCSTAATIEVTVNGTPLTLHGAKTMETAIRESGLPINPGDLISLQGNVLKRSEGAPFYATVNGQETDDPSFALNNGDVIEVTDGEDRLEDYDAEASVLPHDATVVGMGSLCHITPGADGVREHRKGRISGEEVDRTTQPAEDAQVEWYDVDTGGDKVIALTFDEGPSATYTEQILDVLAENDAHATFFFTGTEVEEHPEVVSRAWFEYHQICTGSYDREVTAQSNHEWLAEEVRLGRQAISDAVGGADVSRLVRFPNALLTSEMAAAIDGETDAAVGWNLDTGDSLETISEDTIYGVLMDAQPGDIVVMRDGGGNQSNTVAALKRALPDLAAKGYSFITVAQLMEYPHAED